MDGEEREELDNFYQCQMQIDGQIWTSSEQYYQACKFPDDAEYRQTIRAATSGMDSFKLGNAQDKKMRPDWEVVKVDMMYYANFIKFSQNASLCAVLVNSIAKIEAQGNPDGWKIWNEILLERIREELRDENCRNESLLYQRIAYMMAYKAAAEAKDGHRMKVIAKFASKRLPLPDESSDSSESVEVSGIGNDLDGQYYLDNLQPEANGQRHYRRREGGHLYLGMKHGTYSWVVDDVFCPGESTGAAYVQVTDACTLPVGESSWSCFDGTRHVTGLVLIQVS